MQRQWKRFRNHDKKFDILKDQSDSYQREVNSRLTNIKRTVEDLKEKTWKLDNNTRSNLVFYGIKEDGSCCNAEFAVKEVLGKD